MTKLPESKRQVDGQAPRSSLRHRFWAAADSGGWSQMQDIDLLLDLLAPGGKLVYVGLPATSLEFNVCKLVFGGKR